MNTGLPRQVTVTLWPSAIGARSTTVEASAITSAEGFMVSISGQATQAAQTTTLLVAARHNKSPAVSPPSADAEVAIPSMERERSWDGESGFAVVDTSDARCLKK